MTTRLHQILAVAKTVRASSDRVLTDSYHAIQKPAPLLGLSRTYQPINEEDTEFLPSESTKVQTTVPEIIGVIRGALTRLFDITAEQEWTNCVARADVTVDGQVLIRDAPVTYLLFLERKLVDLRTFISKLPTNDPSEEWTFDAGMGHYKAGPIITNRTKKVPRNHEKAPATDKHAAQVEMYYEDVVVGRWSKMLFSGMIQPTEAKALLERVETLQQAVKIARQAANDAEVVDAGSPGAAFFGYLFRTPS